MAIKDKDIAGIIRSFEERLIAIEKRQESFRAAFDNLKAELEKGK